MVSLAAISSGASGEQVELAWQAEVLLGSGLIEFIGLGGEALRRPAQHCFPLWAVLQSLLLPLVFYFVPMPSCSRLSALGVILLTYFGDTYTWRFVGSFVGNCPYLGNRFSQLGVCQVYRYPATN